VFMHVLNAGALYCALPFGAGFVLGGIRVLWVVPRVGERTAELMETPIMLVVLMLAARWVARRLALASTPTEVSADCLYGFERFNLQNFKKAAVWSLPPISLILVLSLISVSPDSPQAAKRLMRGMPRKHGQDRLC
jgi:hypothetical protein